jgi:hypothetical protein
MNQIVQTITKERDDYRIVKIFDEIGNEWATNITTYNAECKHCDFVQVQNRDNIVFHLKSSHNIEYKD